MRRMKQILIVAAIGCFAVMSMAADDCSDTPKTAEEQRRSAVDQRTGNFSRAEAIAPAPNSTNFPLRKALVEFTKRQDLLNHPWYVYILGDNGNVIGYYVAQTKPVNSCNFLSSTEDVDWNEGAGGVVLTAPSLDGIFYGGSGGAASCDAWFFFDTTTDALVEIRGVKFFTADQPLRLDAKPIEVQTK